MSRRTLAALAASALGVWGFFPVVLLALHASAIHARWTGADGVRLRRLSAGGSAPMHQYGVFSRSLTRGGEPG